MAKLIRCDGRELTVRDVGPVVYRVLATVVPIKRHGSEVLEDDDEARRVIRELLATGLYRGEAVR